MRNILLYTTLAFISVNVLSGVFVNQFTLVDGINIDRLSEARWVLIAMMPVILMVNFVWLRSTATTGKFDISMQVIGQSALFIAPYYWLFKPV